MNDRIDFGSEPWQAIPRRVLRDSNLTARAKGGLVTLLSHEEGWVRSCIAILMKECKVGRKQAQAIMAELREEGYAELVKEHEGNLIKTRYIVRAVPESATFQAQLVASSDLPVSGTSRSGSTGNGAAVVDPQDVDPLDEEPQALDPFGQFWKIYPRREKKREAAKAFANALKRVPLHVVLAGAARYLNDPNRRAGFTMHPATWLNGDCWDDDPLPEREKAGHEPLLDRLAREALEEVSANGGRNGESYGSQAPLELPRVASQ